MTDKQLSFKDDELIKTLNRVYGLFRKGEFAKAIAHLEEALKIDYDYPGITSALKCANFWLDKKAKGEKEEDLYQRGEYLTAQWAHFTSFVQRVKDVSEKCLYSLKQWVFGTALSCYKDLYDKSSVYDSRVLLKIGRCYKGVGNYASAIEFLEIANQQKGGSPVVLSELADCYAQINELRTSKVFFREAFFIDPQGIDLSRIESAMIHRLVDKLEEKGFSGSVLAEWIPVFGAIFGVFNVKRELRPIEFGRLKQNIFKLEIQLKEGKAQKELIVPRLIKHYFWLIDHYVTAGEEKSKIEEVLRKIQAIDPVIYKEYTK